MCNILLLFSTEIMGISKIRGASLLLLLRFGGCTRFRWLLISFPEKTRMPENQHKLNIDLHYQFFARVSFQPGTQYHLSWVNNCSIKMGGSLYKPLSCLCSAWTLSALRTLLTRDPTLEFKPQAQATAHSTGLWELGSAVLI